jgi:hypothetical protein
MKNIKFYTTAGCHLCDEAYAMIMHLKRESNEVAENVNFQLVDIGDNDVLVEKYGIRIPILVFKNSELSWPFKIEELFNWVVEKI